MRLATSVIALLLAVTLTACSSSGDGSSSADGSSQTPKRVAALGLGDVDTLLALGIEPVLVAPWAKDAVEPVGEWAKPLLKSKPQMVLGTSTEVDTKALEKLAATKPDVIVAVNSGFNDATYQRLEAIAPVVRRPAKFEAWSVPWEEQVRAISAGVSKAAEGDALIAKTNETINRTKAQYPQFQGRTGASILPKSDGGFYVYSTGDGRGQVLQLLGFTLPESVSKLIPAGKFFAEISAENLSVLDLDMLVYLDYGTKVSEDTAFRSLKVSRDKRVATIDQNLGNAMSMPNPVTLEWVLKTLPPKLPA
ncbi:iron-siderophore ABC transporter substrate-binding protein [Tsukamurella serpentis]